ncbi:protein SFI1 homolog [Octopus bimaculoides]|nr:protein SFI1 homolog [Octopus bimaculoides]|eukprot:XP_014783390.1 PREDICTED: protein SFI1 homolog [Octopus bimaculoides]
METAARKHHRHKCIQVTFHRFYTIFKSHSISLLHYRHYTIKKVFHLWKRATTISMAESHHLVLNMMKSCDQLILRRAIAHWLNQLWLVRESHRANQWMLRRFLKKWHRKWHNKTEWHQHVVKTIHSQKKSKILKQWQRNVNCRKNQCISATEHIQKLYLMKLFAKWKNFSQRQKQTRFCLRSQQEKWWKRMKMVCFENWRCFFIKRLQAKLIHQCWSYMCVRKAIKHWKELHHQVALEKFANHYKSVQKNLQLRACFKRWTSTLQKVYEEKEEAKQAEKMLQDKLVHFIFLQWYRMSLNSQTSKPLLLRYHNKLLARVTKSWHQLIIRKHQCSDNSLLVYRSQLSKYFTRWRRLHVVYDCERCIKERKNKLALQQCFSGWKQVINRRQLASHFHRKSLLRRFITWRRRAQQKIRKKILLEAEMRRNVLHQKTFFNQWRWNVKRWKSARSEALINIEKLIKKNQMTGAFDTWRRALSNLLLARDYNNCYQMALVRQILMEWHSYTEKVFTKAVIRLQMSLQMDTWLCGSTELQLLDSSDYESQDGLEVLEEGQPEQLEDGASPGTFMKYKSVSFDVYFYVNILN